MVVEHDGRRWLVAPYGVVSWVHNARASGQVRLARRRDTHAYAVREVRGYFQADQNDPVERFIAEAEQHPVFELTPIGPDSPPLSREGPGPE